MKKQLAFIVFILTITFPVYSQNSNNTDNVNFSLFAAGAQSGPQVIDINEIGRENTNSNNNGNADRAIIQAPEEQPKTDFLFLGLKFGYGFGMISSGLEGDEYFLYDEDEYHIYKNKTLPSFTIGFRFMYFSKKLNIFGIIFDIDYSSIGQKFYYKNELTSTYKEGFIKMSKLNFSLMLGVKYKGLIGGIGPYFSLILNKNYKNSYSIFEFKKYNLGLNINVGYMFEKLGNLFFSVEAKIGLSSVGEVTYIYSTKDNVKEKLNDFSVLFTTGFGINLTPKKNKNQTNSNSNNINLTYNFIGLKLGIGLNYLHETINESRSYVTNGTISDRGYYSRPHILTGFRFMHLSLDKGRFGTIIDIDYTRLIKIEKFSDSATGDSLRGYIKLDMITLTPMLAVKYSNFYMGIGPYLSVIINKSEKTIIQSYDIKKFDFGFAMTTGYMFDTYPEVYAGIEFRYGLTNIGEITYHNSAGDDVTRKLRNYSFFGVIGIGLSNKKEWQKNYLKKKISEMTITERKLYLQKLKENNALPPQAGDNRVVEAPSDNKYKDYNYNMLILGFGLYLTTGNIFNINYRDTYSYPYSEVPDGPQPRKPVIISLAFRRAWLWYVGKKLFVGIAIDGIFEFRYRSETFENSVGLNDGYTGFNIGANIMALAAFWKVYFGLGLYGSINLNKNLPSYVYRQEAALLLEQGWVLGKIVIAFDVRIYLTKAKTESFDYGTYLGQEVVRPIALTFKAGIKF